MSKTRHAPAPWRVGPVDDTRVIDATGSEAAAIDGDYNDPETWPVMEANARLIAAAPGLLSALEKAVDAYGKPGGPWNVPSEPGTWIADARAAIAAARGEDAR